MNYLFKVILLCAILSNAFTPCFSEETQISPAEELSKLPLAVPEEIQPTKSDDSKEIAEIVTPVAEEQTTASTNTFTTQNNMQLAQSDMAIQDEIVDLYDTPKIAACPVANDALLHRTGTVEAFKSAYKCLYGRDLTAIILEKGRKFEVKSIHEMSFESTSKSEIAFESIYPERLFYNKDPEKLIFKGQIIKNNPPRKGGGSGTLKVKITGIKVGNVTYPAEAYISKMNKKNVMFGAVAVPSKYKENLQNTVNAGTINNYYNTDPCSKVHDNCVNNAVKPFYFITGAALQTADLFLAPIIAFFAPGNEILIPEGTEFEIKLEGDVPVLDL